MKLAKHRGILLQLGCSELKQPGFVGMDSIAYTGVDILHDFEKFPYPVKDNDCLTIIVKQVVERIKPWLTVQFFDELWRITKPDGQLVIQTPYAGSSLYWQDPMNCNGFTERTFMYFDPAIPAAYARYKPKPWRIEKGFPMWQSNGFIEMIMSKRGLPSE